VRYPIFMFFMRERAEHPRAESIGRETLLRSEAQKPLPPMGFFGTEPRAPCSATSPGTGMYTRCRAGMDGVPGKMVVYRGVQGGGYTRVVHREAYTSLRRGFQPPLGRGDSLRRGSQPPLGREKTLSAQRFPASLRKREISLRRGSQPPLGGEEYSLRRGSQPP